MTLLRAEKDLRNELYVLFRAAECKLFRENIQQKIPNEELEAMKLHPISIAGKIFVFKTLMPVPWQLVGWQNAICKFIPVEPP